MNKQIGRNDPCPCGSGKKYKKCCEARLGRRKFSATVLHSGNKQPDKAVQISTNFFNKLFTPKKTEVPAPEQNASAEAHHPPEADKPM